MYYKDLYETAVSFINDLMDDSGRFYKYEQCSILVYNIL